jgi:Holliday junction resolvase RusA-like endonuclease
MIEITLENCLPLPWKAPYVGSRGAFSPRYNEAKIIKAMIREQYTGSLISGQLRVDFEFYMPIPKRTSKKKTTLMLEGTIRPQGGGDVSNIRKLFEDLMEGIVYENDRQIIAGWAIKSYDLKPSVYISIDRY